MKKILFLEIYPAGVKEAFNKYGYDVVEATVFGTNNDMSSRALWIEENGKSFGIEVVFSFDFDVYIAEACHECKIVYISWTVDSPHLSLYSTVANYDTNRIFVFDNDEYRTLIDMGKKNVYYQHLATDVGALHKTAISDFDKQIYCNEVSFMGNLYDDDKHSMYDKITYIPDYLRGYLDGLFEVQMKVWGIDVFRTDAFTEIISELKKYVKVELDNKYDNVVYSMFCDSMMGMKVAQKERHLLCDILCDKYDFALYTGSDTSYNSKINNKGYIDYLSQMPMMFNRSKINININLHCISSGIPLRVLDIMACEGFCLTNYQSEVAEYFVDGKEVVMFSSIEDMIEKIDYYLEHEEERKQIARSGYEKVVREFDYSVVIPHILERV